eukprot:m.77391 g.77391  ORF g.77391 m.77391 type:complete len:81 (+) comp11915_c0_seq4:870-1112(+)
MAPLKVVAAVVNGAAAISVFNASTSSCENAATKLSLTLTHNEKVFVLFQCADAIYWFCVSLMCQTQTAVFMLAGFEGGDN